LDEEAEARRIQK
jgi:hypothetical protein